MSTGQNCIYKSVNLVAGETFTIPANAELVSVSSLSAISTTCPTTNLEELACYSYKILGADDEAGTTPGATDETFLVGMMVNGVTYNLDTPTYVYWGAGDATASTEILTALNSIMNVFSLMNIEQGADSVGWVSIGTFATLPSIGNDMYLIVRTRTVQGNLGQGTATTLVKVVPTADYTTYYGDGALPPPACLLNSGSAT